MNMVPLMRSTACATCGTEANASEVYPANFDFQAFSPSVFSARRLPDRIHYRLVRCDTCGLLRSDPVADQETIAALYRQSTFDYGSEVPNLVRTYSRYLLKLDRDTAQPGSLLEVGCGNGFFLAAALERGYRDVWGVEPSKAAVAGAPAELRDRIVCDIMRPGLFEKERFDVICAFQVLDHLPDPRGFLELSFELLRPGGSVLCLNHNIAALSARLLGERSPIIDIEHTFLYSRATLSRLFEKCGFRVERMGAALNTYSLRYLARLVPAPDRLKKSVIALSDGVGLGRLRLRVPLGNLYAVARKPVTRSC